MNSSFQVTVIIPAKNEAPRIRQVIEEAKSLANEIIVVDDNSTDKTKSIAANAGTTAIKNELKPGYIGAVKTGFQQASQEIIVTMDADGEHDPKDIPNLVEPIRNGSADVVLGRRKEIARPSERLLCWLARLQVNVEDCGTGFRALRREFATRLQLEGHCTCGTFVLEAKSLGARITEVSINLRSVDKPRDVAWKHLLQARYVLRLLFT